MAAPSRSALIILGALVLLRAGAAVWLGRATHEVMTVTPSGETST